MLMGGYLPRKASSSTWLCPLHSLVKQLPVSVGRGSATAPELSISLLLDPNPLKPKQMEVKTRSQKLMAKSSARVECLAEPKQSVKRWQHLNRGDLQKSYPLAQRSSSWAPCSKPMLLSLCHSAGSMTWSSVYSPKQPSANASCWLLSRWLRFGPLILRSASWGWEPRLKVEAKQ